jgi:uncharacterized protein (DUF885 family)
MDRSRRSFLVGASASAALFPAAGARAEPPVKATPLGALFDKFTEANLARSPELLTKLGLDHGRWADAKFKLDDRSFNGVAQDRKVAAEQLAALKAVDRAALSGSEQVSYDAVRFTLEMAEEGHRRFAYGDARPAGPYVVSQLTGAYQATPDFLDTQHAIDTRQDADGYLARMEAFARQIEDESELARRDAGLGVVAPDFILDKTLAQMDAFLAHDADTAPIVRSLARRAKDKGVAGDWASPAARIYADKIAPALIRQAELMRDLRRRASHDAGVWRLPDGEAYYATALKTFTTSSIAPAEVHALGLDLVAELSAKVAGLMAAQGLTQGTVAERFRALYADPAQRYPNTDVGKAQLIADLNAKVATVQAKLPAWFKTVPQDPIEVRRVPEAIEAGAPYGYYNRAPLDGSRPAIYWINLRDTAAQPRFILPTLTFHEVMPGHHLQLAIQAHAQLPLIRKVIWFSAYGEGWALYAERLADEMGLYETDPYGRIGMLHDALFRAVRMVVDSGLHAKRWSREQAIAYYVSTLGNLESAAIPEVERYCVWPGQAPSYMVGANTWSKLRSQAQAELGPRFDIREFHDAGLKPGPVPLATLETVIGGYLKAATRPNRRRAALGAEPTG